MKRQIILVFFMFAYSHISACLSAGQNRLFPLGTTSEGLCVVELNMSRTEYSEKGIQIKGLIPAWQGKSLFRIYDKQHKVVYTEVLDTFKLFKESEYLGLISKSFQKGLLKANNYSDLVSAKPTSILFCDFQESCTIASLEFDTIANSIRVRLPSNDEAYNVDVLFDSSSIASNLLAYLGAYDDTQPLAKAFSGNLLVSSVRKLQVENKNLFIVHIAKGQKYEEEDGNYNPPGILYKADFPFVKIEESVFEEPVLHHGQGFDFFIWE